MANAKLTPNHVSAAPDAQQRHPTISWFDLPGEVKQIILSMVSDVDSVVYMPIDKRRKVDYRYLEARHFHNLLLVSKTFITPNEFAFAILSSATLTLHSYNEFRRLTEEISTTSKECVRSLHLRRDCPWVPGYRFSSFQDSFDNFTSIEKKFSTHMPNLRQVHISWPEYCGLVGWLDIRDPAIMPLDENCTDALRYILSESREGLDYGHFSYRQSLSHVMASFLGDRRRGDGEHNWYRPVAWMRRLILYAETANIEVVLHAKICVGYTLPVHYVPLPDGGDLHINCFSERYTDSSVTTSWQIHVDATMSSKDYMMKIEYMGQQYAYHQDLAYDLLHLAPHGGQKQWLALAGKVARYTYAGAGF